MRLTATIFSFLLSFFFLAHPVFGAEGEAEGEAAANERPTNLYEYFSKSNVYRTPGQLLATQFNGDRKRVRTWLRSRPFVEFIELREVIAPLLIASGDRRYRLKNADRLTRGMNKAQQIETIQILAEAELIRSEQELQALNDYIHHQFRYGEARASVAPVFTLLGLGIGTGVATLLIPVAKDSLRFLDEIALVAPVVIGIREDFWDRFFGPEVRKIQKIYRRASHVLDELRRRKAQLGNRLFPRLETLVERAPSKSWLHVRPTYISQAANAEMEFYRTYSTFALSGALRALKDGSYEAQRDFVVKVLNAYYQLAVAGTPSLSILGYILRIRFPGLIPPLRGALLTLRDASHFVPISTLVDAIRVSDFQRSQVAELVVDEFIKFVEGRTERIGFWEGLRNTVSESKEDKDDEEETTGDFETGDADEGGVAVAEEPPLAAVGADDQTYRVQISNRPRPIYFWDHRSGIRTLLIPKKWVEELGENPFEKINDPQYRNQKKFVWKRLNGGWKNAPESIWLLTEFEDRLVKEDTHRLFDRPEGKLIHYQEPDVFPMGWRKAETVLRNSPFAECRQFLNSIGVEVVVKPKKSKKPEKLIDHDLE